MNGETVLEQIAQGSVISDVQVVRISAENGQRADKPAQESPHVLLQCCLGSCGKKVKVPEKLYRAVLRDRMRPLADRTSGTEFHDFYISSEGTFYCSFHCYDMFVQD